MNVYQILDIRSGEVRSMLRARNRKQAAWKAAKAGRKYFRVRCLFRSMRPFLLSCDRPPEVRSRLSANIAFPLS